MESLKTMHIKRFVAHLLTFRHTVYYRIWFFCRPFRRTGREHHKTSDKPPPAGVGSRDGLLYVYHTADCSPLWCVVGCVVLYRTRRRPLVRCRSPPNVQDSQKFLNDLEDKTVKAKLFCPEIAGLFCRIAGLFCHDSRANLSLKPVCFGIAIS